MNQIEHIKHGRILKPVGGLPLLVFGLVLGLVFGLSASRDGGVGLPTARAQKPAPFRLDSRADGGKPAALAIATSPEYVVDCYDAEKHLGLVANDPAKAGENLRRLNDAMAAMWSGGSFPFEGGLKPGPILKPIRAAAKEFFFNGTILSPWKMGGVLLGSGGRSYALPSGQFDLASTAGGAVTRFTRINGEAGGPILRLRGTGFKVEGINFRGRVSIDDTTGEGPDGAGAVPQHTVATPIGIEVEGRPYPSSSSYIIRDCSIDDCTVGICCKAGYYDGNGKFVDCENNADTSYVQGVIFNRVPTVFRSESQQAMGWGFSDISVNGPEVVLLDIPRGGIIAMDRVWLQCWNSLTLLQVRDYSPNNCRITIRDFRWDHVPNPKGYLTVFKYTGVTENVSWRKWTLRVEGSMSNYDRAGYWDASKLIQVPKTAQNFPFDDILIDVTGVPEAKFKRQGRWLVPTSEWQN